MHRGHRRRWAAAVPAVLFVTACSTGGESARPDPFVPPGDGSVGVDAGPPRIVPPGCEGIDPDDFTGCDAGSPPPDARTDDDAGTTVAEDASVPLETRCPLDDPYGIEDVTCPEACLIPSRVEDPCDGASRIAGGLVEHDTVWEGRLCVDASVVVMPGVTLTIAPGTELFFADFQELRVEGHLRAVGTAAEPILLSSASREPLAAQWRGIAVGLTEGGHVTLDHAIVEFAEYGVGQWEHVSDPTYVEPALRTSVSHTTLRFNLTAIITDDNTSIHDSTVACNGSGIFVASEDTPIEVIQHNNICHNTQFGLGAFQDGVDARRNYWCTVDPDEVDAAVFDRRDVSTMGGIADTAPFLDAPAPDAPALP